MSDHTPEQRAARIKLDFTIEPETEKRLRAAIAAEIRSALIDESRLPVTALKPRTYPVQVATGTFQAIFPQDRTRAIVSAAEAFAKAAEITIDTQLGGRGFVTHNAIEVDDFTMVASRALHDLARALALPEPKAPQWTRTPPSASGTYWMRTKNSDPQLIDYDGALWRYHGSEAHSWVDPSNASHLLYWPLPIEPPPVKT